MIRKHPGAAALVLPLLFLIFTEKASAQDRYWEVLTFLGGKDDTTDGLDFLYDAKRDRYILVGKTQERDLPVTPDAMKTRLTDQLDGFIAVFNGDCSELVYCSYIGGSRNDAISSAVLLDADRMLIGLGTYSQDLPTTGTAWFATAPGNGTTWLAVLSLDTFSVLDAGYFSGSNDDSINRLMRLGNGDICLTGNTESSDLPITPNAFQARKAGYSDAFIAIFDSTFELTYCSYHGGSTNYEDAWKGLAETENYIVFSGLAYGSGLPVTGDAHQKNFAGGYFDCYLTVVSKDGMGRVYSSYLGGSGREGINAIVPVGGDRIVIVGSTDSRDFPVTANAWQPVFGDPPPRQHGDVFLGVFSLRDAQFEQLTYYGGSGNDFAKSAIFDPESGEVIILATSLSYDFPLVSSDTCECFYRGAIIRFDPRGMLPRSAIRVVDIGNNTLDVLLRRPDGRLVFSGTNSNRTGLGLLPVRSTGVKTVRTGFTDLFIGILRDTPVGVEAVVEVSPGSIDLVTFPQPVRETLRFAVEGTGDGEAVLTDLLGRRLLSVPLQGDGTAIRGTLTLGGVAPGMYMLVVRTPDMVRTGKVIVAN
ncbi:MAG: T9SS type A sorting domain-containing protein [Bacteroidota bacterium]|jgi:hypothetical protein|nr:T9SS type A sorting domain-containing protein [Bacteroidota bacterium]